MSKVNVNRSIEDPFCRYQMSLVETTVKGHGNGTKTVISNIEAVAKALGRPPAYICKFLGVEVGAQTTIDVKNNRYIVNGEFDATRFQDLLDGFIKKFVLCPQCGNPETKLRVTSKKLIESKCIACGHRSHLPMVHKLTTYIINNPPITGVNGSGGRSGDTTSSNIDQHANGGKIDAPPPSEDGDEDDDWSDTSEAAVKARSEGLGAATQFTATEDLENSTSTRLDIFNAFVVEKSKMAKLPAKEVLGEAERLEVKEKGVMVIASVLWDTKDVPAAMKKYQALVQRFTFESKKAQMYALNSLEKLIELDETRLNKTPRYLKTMYDLDLVDEEVFVAWEKKLPKIVTYELAMKIRAEGAPFLTWIKEAEEEELSEDENIVFEETPMENPVKAKTVAKEPEPVEEVDDDFIDGM
jgi:translation initiation factor 5